MTSPLLEVEGLRKNFALTGPTTWAARLRGERPAVRAVDGVSFAVAKGETLGLVGEFWLWQIYGRPLPIARDRTDNGQYPLRR